MSGQEWRDQRVLRNAWRAAQDRITASGGRVSTITLGMGADPQRREPVRAWTLLLAPPWGRAIFDDGTGSVDVVTRLNQWWSNANGVSRSNETVDSARFSHGLGWGEDLVRTHDYVDCLQITSLEKSSWLGRLTLDVIATLVHEGRPRRGSRGLHGLTLGDPALVSLTVDIERGVILRSESWFEGSMYRSLRVTEVYFDEQFPADTFNIEPLPGQQWTPPLSWP